VTVNASVPDGECAIDDRICEALSKILQRVQREGKTDEDLEHDSGVNRHTIKAYRLQSRKPSLGAGLMIASAVGGWAVNRVLSCIQYGNAKPLGEEDTVQPMQLVADAIGHLGVIGQAAADGRIDHTEAPMTTEAADKLIATVLPLSSARKRA
jgi:hypothetical protein